MTQKVFSQFGAYVECKLSEEQPFETFVKKKMCRKKLSKTNEKVHIPPIQR